MNDAHNADAKAPIQKLRIIYLVFFCALCATLLPTAFVSLFAIMLSVCTLAFIYSKRAGVEEGTLTHNHLTYLIRTFWWLNLLFLGTAIFGILYFIVFADYVSLDPCINYLQSHSVALAKSMDISNVSKILDRCGKIFMQKNETQITVLGMIAFIPVLFFLAAKFFIGWKKLIKGQKINYN